MRVLYHIPFAAGLGADRWVYEGFRDAFRELGHDFAAFEHRDDLGRVFLKFRPDFFITSQNDLLQLDSHVFEALRAYRRDGGKVAVRTGEDFALGARHREVLRDTSWVDFYFTSYGAHVMGGFERLASVPLWYIPFAANTRTHFPVPPSPKYACDICFVGGNLPRKRAVFQKLLAPLFKTYRVRVYGPGWTLCDRTFALLGRLMRAGTMEQTAALLYRARVTLPADEERALYSSAKICLNIHEYDDAGTVLGLSNEREFKIPAGGGFQLSDFCPGLSDFFTPDKEIVIAETRDAWFRKIRYYLEHDEARRAIQATGTARALRDHTYIARVRQLLSSI